MRNDSSAGGRFPRRADTVPEPAPKPAGPLAQRLAVAGHERLPHANPLSTPQVRGLVDGIAAFAPATALDVGCGPGSLSLLLAERCRVQVTAIDTNPGFVERAARSLSPRKLPGQIRYLCQDASALSPDVPFDAVLCVGSSQAFGSPAAAVDRCVRLLKPGGVLLFAELVWIAPPPPAFLDFLRIAESFYWADTDKPAVFAAAGLRIRQVVRASQAAWKDYEDEVRRARLRYADTLEPGEAAVVRERVRLWGEARAAWGQHCLGFTAWLAVR